MGANRGREIPDATPPFLTKEAIDGWIEAAVGAESLKRERQLHEFDKGQLHLIHKVEKLAGDGEQDVGSVGRLEKLVTDYIKENREASQRASTERQEVTASVEEMAVRIRALEDAEERATLVEEQVNQWKLIPVFTRNAWKIIAAVATLTLALMGIWDRLQPRVLTPQQIQQIRKSE